MSSFPGNAVVVDLPLRVASGSTRDGSADQADLGKTPV